MKKLITIFVILNSFQALTVAQTTITEVKNDTTLIYTVDKKGYVTNIEVIPPAENSTTIDGENYTTCPQQKQTNTNTITTSASKEEIERKKKNKRRRKILANATIDALLGTTVILMQDSYRLRGY